MKNLLIVGVLVLLGVLGAGGYLAYVGDGPDPLVASVTGEQTTARSDQVTQEAQQSSISAPPPSPQEAEEAEPTAQVAQNTQPPAVETGPVRFDIPIACSVGADCAIQNHVDMASGPTYQDHTCGPLSYNEHTGTDFRLPSHEEMEAGVDVLAAAQGEVIRIRDGMPDVNFRLVGREAVTDRGLGNVVLVRHRDGFVTGYAHLKRGSIIVQEGDSVQRGQVLGEVGLSGLTEFPHLHFEIRRNNQVFDPFTGLPQESGCGQVQTSLWSDAAQANLPHIATMVVRMGFADKTLNRAAVEYGLLAGDDSLSQQTESLLLHVYLAGVREGDIATFQIFGPDQTEIINTQRVMEKDAAVQLLRAGAARRDQPWQSGPYSGVFTLTRSENGAEIEVIRGRSSVSVR